MSAKIKASRKAAFLKALGKSGNQTLAAERTKVSRSWVVKHRCDDAAVREAVERAKETLVRAPDQVRGARGSNRPPAGWGHLDGVELVVRGTGGDSGPGGGKRVQIARARLHQWDARVEDRSLAVLAATLNVKAAYTAVGMSKGSAYTHRKRWPEFARRWDEAEKEGEFRLEWALIEHGSNPFSSRGAPEPIDVPPPSPQEALHCLHMHKHRLHGFGQRPGLRARRPAIEAVKEKIIRRAELIKRARAIPAKELERDRAEWARRRHGGG